MTDRWALLLLVGFLILLVIIVVTASLTRTDVDPSTRPPDVDPCEMTGGANVKEVGGWTYICHKD